MADHKLLKKNPKNNFALLFYEQQKDFFPCKRESAVTLHYCLENFEGSFANINEISKANSLNLLCILKHRSDYAPNKMSGIFYIDFLDKKPKSISH